jgi:TatD DNase family protein
VQSAQLIDSHAHLTDERFDAEVDGVLERALAAGVGAVVSIASDLEDSERTVAFAGQSTHVYASVGIHPHAADSASEQSWVRLRELAALPRVVGIGETGLDFHYDNSPRSIQIEVFARQLELAREMDLPVVVHAREADDEVIRVIRASAWGRGVLHCFSSGRQLLEEALALGWYVSFAGMITFPKWDGAELLRAVPDDRLLIETDSPYLAPVPHRGKRNEPAFVRLVADRAAEIRGVESGTLRLLTTANAIELFRLPVLVADS